MFICLPNYNVHKITATKVTLYMYVQCLKPIFLSFTQFWDSTVQIYGNHWNCQNVLLNLTNSTLKRTHPYWIYLFWKNVNYAWNLKPVSQNLVPKTLLFVLHGNAKIVNELKTSEYFCLRLAIFSKFFEHIHTLFVTFWV